MAEYIPMARMRESHFFFTHHVLMFSRAILPSIGSPAYILIYGSVNYDHGDYFVSTSSDNAWPSTTTLNGESPWISLNEVIYFGQVDEGETVLQNIDQENWLDFTKIVYTTASGYVHCQPSDMC